MEGRSMKTLTIYEKHPTLDAYRFGPSFTPYAVVAKDKRLTDPELGAILWFHVSREAHAEAMGWRTGHAQDWINTNQEECRIVRILERFASLPHYDEETP
jgi:hypothetical protein